ncbi:hypothetical protein [Tenacibaculum agarivorans]|uniref:hypothetical protein n=1 Tax=Tenacibaculum agarivorans TaxID=1908389 RepID=UPI00094B8BC6|nr:hypothetical protein [Tenacibaculum agarivorans]
MRNWILILTIHLACIPVFSQSNNCGFKTECECDTTKQTITYSVTYSDIVVQGTIKSVDTLDLSQIITKEAVLKIKQDTLPRSECAKSTLKDKKVLRSKIQLEKIYKGQSNQKYIYIITPIDKKFCSYSDFTINQEYLIYGTKNKTADNYFLWTFDQDYFLLKKEYIFWTNKCKRTKLTELNELKIIEDLTKT